MLRYLPIITAIQGYSGGYYLTKNRYLTNMIMDVDLEFIGLTFADNNIHGGAESTILAIFENNHVRTLQLYKSNCIFR